MMRSAGILVFLISISCLNALLGLGRKCQGVDSNQVRCGAPPLAIVKEFKVSALVCDNGKLRMMSKKLIQQFNSQPLKQGDCQWYNEFYCDGDLVEDLYRWWFYKKCSGGVMSIFPRPWQDIVSDPRYKSDPPPFVPPPQEIEPVTESKWLLSPKRNKETKRTCYRESPEAEIVCEED